MPMGPCNKCLNNYWLFEHIDGYTIATCQMCGHEVEFPSKETTKIQRKLLTSCGTSGQKTAAT